MNVIHENFKHGENFRIGEFCYIHENCQVGDDVQIRSHVELRAGTVIGNNCYIDSGVKSSGRNKIGDNVIIRYDSIIARDVTIEDDVFISPQVMTIYSDHKREKHPGTVIGRGAFIATQALLGASVKIGPETVIGSKSYVENCIIGRRCMIRAGVKIGSKGLNVKRDSDGKLLGQKARGKVILKDFVDVGANSVINRGVEGDTVIGENTFIGPLVDIGHDTKIGRSCIIGTMSLICGHVKIGDYARVSPGSVVKNRVKIGDHAFVGIGSLVMRDIPAWQTAVGRPAVDIEKLRAKKR